jgi:photosystem II stability/assembly factor-like uncharacterized protein
LLTSSDGSAWAARSTQLARSGEDIVWNGSEFVVVDFAGGLLVSPDGVGWTRRSAPDFPVSIAWTGNQFALTTELGEVWTSPDAVDWTNRSAPQFPYNAVAGNTSTIVAVGGRDTFATFIATSGDGGTTWKDHSILTSTDRLQAVLWNGSQFVSVGSHGRVMTSADGATWTTQSSGTTASLSGIAWDGQQFVVVGDTEFLTSPDAAAWTAHPWGTLPAASAIAWNGHHFVAVGANGAMLFSADAIDWTQVPPVTNHTLTAIAAGGSPDVQFVAVGTLGDLLYSTDEVFVDSFELVPSKRPSLRVATLPRSGQAQNAFSDEPDAPADTDTRVRAAADDGVQLARPAEKPSLSQRDEVAGRGEPVRDEIRGGRTGRAARCDVLDAAVVVPGAALAPLDVEHVDKLRTDRCEQ